MSKVRTVISLAVVFGLLVLSGQMAVWSFSLNEPLPSSGAAQTAQDEKARAPQSAALKLIRKVDAAYPPEARDKKIAGKVAVSVTINEQGEVAEASVKEGPELLHKAALAAARQSLFSPPAKKTVGTIVYDFRLDQDKEKTAAPEQPAAERATKEPAVKLIERVDPVYPPEASEKGVQGKVVVEITINEEGIVSDAKVKQGPELLHQAALEAARQWRFANRLKEKVTVTITLNFEL